MLIPLAIHDGIDGGISTADAASNINASVTLPLIDIHRPSRRLIAYTENYTGDTETKMQNKTDTMTLQS